jgi:hypothetical protein
MLFTAVFRIQFRIQDPYVLGLLDPDPYGSRSFHQQAKNEEIDFFLSYENDVNVPSKRNNDKLSKKYFLLAS